MKNCDFNIIEHQYILWRFFKVPKHVPSDYMDCLTQGICNELINATITYKYNYIYIRSETFDVVEFLIFLEIVQGKMSADFLFSKFNQLSVITNLSTIYKQYGSS